ncbi:thiol reductant ABC exporter subunit CydD [Alicyclobacillaceae bacterium I2511]|nr:thiol reductant ABC exporter subunit CydD [Alicyclobacillaceae bacterium I2511]
MMRLVQRVQPVRVLLILTVTLGLVSGGLLMVQAFGLAKVVNSVFLEHAQLSQVKTWLWVLLGIILVRGLLTWAGQAVAARFAIRVKTDLRRQLTDQLLRLGPAWAKGEQRGELVNTAVQGIEQLQAYLAKYLPQMAFATLLPLAILGFVVTRDWLTALILGVTAPLIVFFMILVGKMAESTSQQQWQKLSLLAAQLLDVLEGLTTLKVFGRSRAQVQWLGRASEAYRMATLRTLRVAFVSAFLMELFATLSTAVVAVSLGLRLVSGRMSFATAFLVLLLTPEFYQPIRALGSEFHAGLNGVTAAGRVFDILDAQPPGLVPEGGNSAGYTGALGAGEPAGGAAAPGAGEPAGRLRPSPVPVALAPPFTVEFKRVSFTYTPGDAPALQEVSFTLYPGQTLAVVGPSGAGKSTLLDLLQGFLRPTQGEIWVNGVDLQNLPILQWRRQVSLLRQHSHVFAGTIADNLRFARPTASVQDVEQAVATAGAKDWIAQLPQGVDTPVGEGGSTLSGGQVQRLAVARALLKQAPLVLLDEPTAHLDPVTERAVQSGLDRLLVGATALVVAHRLSTVERADEILVLAHGRVVEQGTHTQLVGRKGLYHSLQLAYRGGELG